tara:strand:+ start:1111 stop:1869 length:759 start_codon:yes stop_codon:yes gene_type:complete
MSTQQLIELLTACKAAGMSPSAAAAAVMGGQAHDQVPSLEQARGERTLMGAIATGDLSIGLETVWSGISASELAAILHSEFPKANAVEIAQAVQSALPNTAQSEMYAALTGCGFSQEDAQGAVNILYPASVTVQANQAWQSTGVNLTGKQRTEIRWTGGMWTANPANGMCGGAGDRRFIAATGYTMPGQPEGALIGKVGDNPVFMVGDAAEAPGGQSGLLSLCINDDLNGIYGAGLSDNEGALSVTVETSAT